ncbi:MAG: hypothetical protein ACE5JV_00720, partial [Nitrososphaerales archaeon]
YLHRLIRNVVTAVAVLLVSSFVTPSVSVITNLEVILPISSFITLAVFAYLILDTFFVLNRRMERGIMTSLLSPVKEPGEEDALQEEEKADEQQQQQPEPKKEESGNEPPA